MAESVADYQVLNDGTITLDNTDQPEPNETTLIFKFPSGFVFDNGRRKPILSFNIRTESFSSLRCFLNNREIIGTITFSEGFTRSYSESFNASDAFPEGASFPNDVPLRIILSQGRAFLSDIVIWYQRDFNIEPT